MTSYSILKTPQGELMLVANDSALIGLYFVGCDHVPKAKSQWTHDPQHPVLLEATRQLHDYFEGKRTHFSLPLHFAGTDFQNRVWQEIARISHGKTISYSELARRAGKPQAVRAAGTNTGRNPLAIFVPCHRVLTKKGGIGGFAGGLEWKRYLLDIEKIKPSEKAASAKRLDQVTSPSLF